MQISMDVFKFCTFPQLPQEGRFKRRIGGLGGPLENFHLYLPSFLVERLSWRLRGHPRYDTPLNRVELELLVPHNVSDLVGIVRSAFSSIPKAV